MMAADPATYPASAAGRPPRRRVRWHSRRVAYLKLMLPAVALSIVTLVLAWPQIMPDEKRFRLSSAARIAPEEADNLRMLNARFVGVDEERRPYVVTASSATQASTLAREVDLTEPKADMVMNDGAWVALSSATGVYHRDKRTMDLDGDVSIFHDSGAEFHTTRAQVDLATSAAAGDEPIQGQAPAGTIVAEGFRIYDRGAVILFTGKAKVILSRGTAP